MCQGSRIDILDVEDLENIKFIKKTLTARNVQVFNIEKGGSETMKSLSEVVKLVGISRRVIQEYEDAGLAERPTITNKYGHLLYDKEDIRRFWQLRFYRELNYDKNKIKAFEKEMLAIKISDGKEEWYIMPGGGQDVEELLPDAACREVAEELGLQIEVKDLAFVIEGVHGENFHRVDLVFLCEYKGKIENAILQGDTN